MKVKMYRLILFITLSVLLYISNTYSQIFNNEWINYNQQYFRITVNEDGLYRIPYSDLLQAGVPVNVIDPRNIQIFHNGQEQYIYIEGESGIGIFDPNGYIEFYGKRNRGNADIAFFDSPSSQANPDFSFYNDTSSYFITWNNSINNKRIKKYDNQNFGPYIPHAQTHCFKNVRYNYTGSFYWGSSRAIFTEGTGYFDSSVITDNSSVSKTIPTPNIYNSNIPTKIELAVVGVPASQIISDIPHRLKVDIMGTTMVDQIYYGYQYIRKFLQISSLEIASSIPFLFTSNDTQQPQFADRNAVSYIQVIYPHRWNFGNSSYYDFYLQANTQSDKDYIEVLNFNMNSDVVIFDLTNNLRINTLSQNNKVSALIPNADKERFLVMTNQSGYKQVNGIHKISPDNRFKDYLALYPGADYIIVTNKKLMDASEQYALYRSSTGFNVCVADVDQLYYQFAYGIIKHPVAIRNFANYLYSNDNRERYLFLIGKSIHSRLFRRNSTNFQNCLVPSAGNPSSDNLLTAGLANTGYEPLFHTGRLSANNENQVLSYLSKVMEYENQPPAAWMKNIIHFGGGANATEQTTFQNYLNYYKQVIEDTLFGGRVSSFFKTSSEPIQITQSDSVRNLIENGTTMMTFFGHASASGFDQSIDNPENYNNKGKYPFTLANSCFSGDIHLSSTNSVSENWVMIPDRGTIGFLASVGQGISTYLHFFSVELYRNITYKNYNKSIGKQINNSIKSLQSQYPTNPAIELTCHEFTLHGDPAVVLNSHELPDLVLEQSGVSFIPQEITTSIDSFDVKVLIKNIGRATQDTFLITADRILPDGSEESYFLVVDGCNFMKTVTFRIPVNRQHGPGLNSIRFFADAAYQIEELDKTNNETSVSFLIKSGDVHPIKPYNYAIHPESTVSLKASTIDPFIQNNQYIFQIDTTDYFTGSGGNPMHQNIISSPGGIIKYDVPFTLNENTVYYWRIAEYRDNPDSIVWRESSFIHIPEKEGWSQAHFDQFKENNFRFINYLKNQRKFEFITTPKQLHCYNTGILNSDTFFQIRWTLDGAVMDGQGDYSAYGTAPAMMVVVIDPATLTAWASDKENYGHRNYPRTPNRLRPDYYYIFTSGSGANANIDNLQNMNSLIELVPDGHYLLVYSWGNGYFQQWPENIYQTFENLGSLHIRNLINSHPYIFFAIKGQPNTAQEVFGSSTSDAINLYVNLETDFNYGNIESIKIGPSRKWRSLHWDFKTEDDPENNIVELNVYGIDNLGNSELLIPDISPDNLDIYNLDENIDYRQYPNIKLNFFTRNDSSKIPAHLLKWQVMFDQVPETAIDPEKGYFFCCDTVNEGENIKFAVATNNISNFDMDSLRVKYWLQDNNNNEKLLKVKTLRPHPAGDVIIDTITVSTIGLSGMNSIWVRYNPINELTGNYYQPEQYFFNNIASKFFFVNRDITNPLLDVSFDGRHIMDGEVVSARPEIRIQLKDENKFLPLNDTSLFRIYLTNMESGKERRVYFSTRYHPEEEFHWYPAELPDNSCLIILNPVFESDGMYQLRVQATDISQNESGHNDYVVRFQIIHKSTITHLLNYPNPFSTSTRFVFELTGNEIPEDLRIEIFTVSGKLVKVIHLDEIGPLNIGLNKTEYAWDGTDMYGDRLANGLYFYRVHARINGKSIEHRSTEADKFFKQEIGKMYLIR